MRFDGFKQGTLFTPVPNPVFGPLLEQIEDLAEFKVTIRGMWLLHRKRGRPRMVSLKEFLCDQPLLRGLASLGDDPGHNIRRGLDLAVTRKTFLSYNPGQEVQSRSFYLLNTENDRRALARIKLDESAGLEEEPPSSGFYEEGTPGNRPNIFVLYEDNVGMLTPILAEELKEAEGLYPWSWLHEAFQVSAAENKRSWGYISAILRRWAAEGKDHGKPGRHSQKSNRQKYLEDYERRWGSPPGKGTGP